MTDELENELRNLKLRHLSEGELTSYYNQELDPVRLARVEAHMKQCFICQRQLELLREEIEVLKNSVATTEDVALVERLMEQFPSSPPHVTTPAPTMSESSLKERLAEYCRQMVASWKLQFAQESVRAFIAPDEEVWQWTSIDGRLQARAFIGKKGSLIFHFSSSHLEMEGATVKVRLGQLVYERVLGRASDVEVEAEVEVPRREFPRDITDAAITIVVL